MQVVFGEKFYQHCNECEKPIHYGFFAYRPGRMERGSHMCPECAKVQADGTKFMFTNYRRYGMQAEG